jgi:hypothetical protein
MVWSIKESGTGSWFIYILKKGNEKFHNSLKEHLNIKYKFKKKKRLKKEKKMRRPGLELTIFWLKNEFGVY